MPICPGCEQTVSYNRLDLHQRYCEGIWSPGELRQRSAEHVERRLAVLENRLDMQLEDIESEIERRLVRLEEKSRGTLKNGPE